MAQRLHEVYKSYRIGDPDGIYPIYDPTGARLYPGRWNTAESPVIYTSVNYSTALIEKLVHSRVLPANQHYIEITMPNGTSYETFQGAAHPGWDGQSDALCKAFGEQWYIEGRSALLFVPSFPARIDLNVLINPTHPDAAGIRHGLAFPIWWDGRLYSEGDRA